MSRMTRRVLFEGACASAVGHLYGRHRTSCDPSLETEEGPFFPVEDIPPTNDLTRVAEKESIALGDVIYVAGAVVDFDCVPVPGAAVAIWQADRNGRYRHPDAEGQDLLDPSFSYFGRTLTDEEGRYVFKTILPKPYIFEGLHRARHIHFEIVRQGFDRRVSEMYFPGHDDNRRRRGDDVWRSRDPARRAVLISSRMSEPQRDAFRITERGAPAFCMNFQLSSDLALQTQPG